MNVLVCVKRVPAPGARINITADEQEVDTAFLGFTTSPHEECAVEEAVRLIEKHGGDATVMTLGAAIAEEQLRYAASLGVTKAVLLETDGSDWDPQRTAAAITDAIRQLEADGSPFDIILFGNESADSGGFQVGVRVAVALDRPCVQGIKGIDVGDGVLSARREIDGGFEVYEVPMPAVLGTKEGINLPRYPTMKGRLNSKKVVVTTIVPTAVAGGQAKVRLVRPAETASQVTILGTGPECASTVVDLLEELGVLK